MYALVTASPLDYDGRRSALVCIEDLTLLLSLADALPICMGCKKVRDEGLWMQVEAYLDAHLDLKFSHGLCPECSRRLYPELSCRPPRAAPEGAAYGWAVGPRLGGRAPAYRLPHSSSKTKLKSRGIGL